MAKFLNTHLAYGEIEKITANANRDLVLISPYIQISSQFLERLKDVDRKNFKIILVCREEDLKGEEKINLRLLKNLELRYLKDLHAKCYYNEESMVITSLNLYDYSQQNNHEMGILLNLKDEPKEFNEARNEAGFIIRSAEIDGSMKKVDEREASLKNIKETMFGSPQKQKTEVDVGSSILQGIHKILTTPMSFSKNKSYCIRCGEDIPYSLDMPYCSTHFEKWKEYSNPDYKEKYCHLCGEHHTTSMKHPLCRSCYEKNKQKQGNKLISVP